VAENRFCRWLLNRYEWIKKSVAMDLTPRQEIILKLIVSEYIKTGAPLGSNTLVRKYELGVSSATVRNEMAALEQNGYLIQPHTSAGRIPSEDGFRYFVQKLMDDATLSPAEQLMIQHQFHQARLELDQWMRLSAAVLAHSTHNASLVTSPKIKQCEVKHLELVSIQDRVALLILVLKEGTVKQQIINLQTAQTQDELRAVSRRLTELWSNQMVSHVDATASALTSLSLQVARVVSDMMRRLNLRQTSDMYHAGLLHLLETDVVQSDTLEQVIRILEERRLVEQVIGQTLGQQGVQIIIGGEGQWHDLSQISIVLSSYGTTDGATGALGVVGPIRMPYSRAVSIVQFMSGLMTNLMGDLYGSQTV